MGKSKFLLTALFVLTLGGGVVAGMLASRLPANIGTATTLHTPLAEELRLTPNQSDKMRDIWEGVREKVDDCFVRAQQTQKRRDEALVALLTPEQKVTFAKTQQEYSDAFAVLKSERDAAFADAVKRTETILTEPQKLRYREILQKRLGHGPASGPPDWIVPASLPSPAK